MPRLEPAPSASATPPTSSTSSERKKRKFLPIEELIRQNITNAPPASPPPIPPPKRKRPSASDQAGPSRPRAHAKTAKRARTAEEQAELDDPASGGMALWRAQVADIFGTLRQRAQTPKRESDSGSAYTSGKAKGKERARGPFVQSELPVEYKDFATRDKKYGSLWVRSERNWWPGYLIAFRPAHNHDEKDMWEVAVHPAAGVHRTKRVKAEGMIYRSDNRAADCSRGNYSSEDAVLPSDARTRASTPPIPSPSAAAGPSAPAAFDNLPAKDQLLYLRPHLQRIIDESYPPAQWRNEGFFSRNGKRRKMLDERKESGDVRQNEVMQVVEPELGRWLMRAERWETEPRPKDAPKTEVAPPRGSDRFNALSPADKSDYLSRVLRTEAFIQLRIRTEGLQKLAQAELNRRASDPNPDLASSSSSPKTTDITSLAPSHGAEPPSARELPEAYLRSIARGKSSPSADGAAAPEWVQYSLALALLQELRVKDEVMVWATIEEELKRCRRKARERLGLPDEHEGRAQRIEREKRAKGYKPIWTAGRLTNKVEYDKLF